MAVLAVTEGPSKGNRFVLQDRDSAVVNLGRDPTLQIALEDQSASRRHAQIKCSAGSFQIVDLGSSNGTYVNAERLAPRAPHELEDNDVVKIGKTLALFRSSGQS